MFSDNWNQNPYNRENYRINIYFGKNQMYHRVLCHNIKMIKHISNAHIKTTGKSSLTHIFPLNCQATANITISNIS